MAFPPPLYCVNYARVINLSRAIATIFPAYFWACSLRGAFLEVGSWSRLWSLACCVLAPSPPFFSPPPYFPLPIVKQQVPSALLAFLPPLNPADDRKRKYRNLQRRIEIGTKHVPPMSHWRVKHRCLPMCLQKWDGLEKGDIILAWRKNHSTLRSYRFCRGEGEAEAKKKAAGSENELGIYFFPFWSLFHGPRWEIRMCVKGGR